MLFESDDPWQFACFVGMDFATVTPFIILATSDDTRLDTTFSPAVEGWGLNVTQSLVESITLRKSGGGFELTSEFIDFADTFCLFKASLIETRNHVYSPKEAGFRAKYLIGQSSKMYDAATVIIFAISDVVDINNECSDINDKG
eukprot:TRINITY_DN11785_c0_g1_i11.p1 TRINITY_DN11785_c0_g1~~TRINITY_DN11785_c0_g1_i11.p1  ORF type:complete len:144 (-),score=27.25 TRINITY_DN11785_c0_g1_i11:412-843(-)